ncbi:hypothetical protein MLD38_038804 [Melastoma candidum]|uniref:Uncharacterized protein n=1 Tax=Melastoma candidum TaxID=119954 RepID=A0ACB9L0R4_9MYRT|nr:hypothetical protein MLD38_038804 [Melastoma candidum]
MQPAVGLSPILQRGIVCSGFAVLSSQLILREKVRDTEQSKSKAVVNAQVGDLELQGVDELSSVARDIVHLIETATAPVFAVDSAGHISMI